MMPGAWVPVTPRAHALLLIPGPHVSAWAPCPLHLQPLPELSPPGLSGGGEGGPLPPHPEP